jgi:glycerate 2-kinase
MQSSVSPITSDALSILQAAIRGVDSMRICEQAIQFDGHTLSIGEASFELHRDSKIIVVGAGKAALGMSIGLLRSLQSYKLLDRTFGWVNMPGVHLPVMADADQILFKHIRLHPSRPLGINLPTQAAVDGTIHIRKLVSSASPSDIVICLLSGGGSSLLVDPIEGLSLPQKIELTKQLSVRGADIHQLNSVRRCLSNVKGGGLLRSCKAALLTTLVISDVLDDDLQTIASGPTVSDARRDFDEAIELVESFLPNEGGLNRHVLQLLDRERTKHRSVASNVQSHIEVLANNATAVDAAGVKAVELGYRYAMLCHRKSEGDASEVGRSMSQRLVSMQNQSAVDCEITGGEPTVDMSQAHDPKQLGRGGRNQHAVLAAALAITESDKSIERPFCVLSAGTDGEDGNTTAAGAWFDHTMVSELRRQQSEMIDAFQRFDSNTFFRKLGSTIETGLTGTNVCDIRIILSPSRMQER